MNTTNLTADELTRKYVFSGVNTLDELLDQWIAHRYRPTLRCLRGLRHERLWICPEDEAARLELLALADAYDARAAERGIEVEAYRSTW